MISEDYFSFMTGLRCALHLGNLYDAPQVGSIKILGERIAQEPWKTLAHY